MKIKTSELKDRALDYVVAKCKGKGIEFDDPRDPWLVVDGIADQPLHSYTPSTDWSQGGPIVERERISVVDVDGYDFWKADKLNKEAIPVISYGPTPLIAAMRCYVASKLGDEVEIPEELK